MHHSLKASDKNIVVIVPTPWEAEAIVKKSLPGLMLDGTFHLRPYPVFSQFHPASNTRVSLVVSCFAPHNAAGAVGWANAIYEPKAIFLVGSAGALTPELLPGDIVISSSFRALFGNSTIANRARIGLPAPAGYRYLFKGRLMQGEKLDADPVLLNRTVYACESTLQRLNAWPDSTRLPHYLTGCIGSRDDWTTDPEEFARFRAEGAVAEDMETAQAAMVAVTDGRAVVAIRCISNNGTLGLQPKSLDEVKASSVMAASNAGDVLATALAYTIENRY